MILNTRGLGGAFALMIALYAANGHSQTKNDTGRYNHAQVFGPTSWPYTGNETRSADGRPGPKYWQNAANYTIAATLSEKDTSIRGTETITYVNNGPQALNYLWIQLDQNLFKRSSRGASTTPITGDRFDVKGYEKGGYTIESVEVVQNEKAVSADTMINDARMQVRLAQPLKAEGGSIQLKIAYHFNIPVYGADRMGRLKTRKGVIYEIAQWYPRMCVYDDIEGWNTLPYMGLGEFYCDYGDFDYTITAPANMLVVGSGDLVNASEVLTEKQVERLKKAKESDKTIVIARPGDYGPSEKSGALAVQTWHFQMKHTRDVSWAASQAFIWDAAKVSLPSGKTALAQSAYPSESAGHDGWDRSTEYLKSSIEIYSRRYTEYPWNNAVSVSGVALGMEYPGIIFCMHNFKNQRLWFDVTHEIGHNWFPMIVGSNERKYMWQDEGFNTFINDFSTLEFNGGEYHDPKNNLAQAIIPLLAKNHDPLMTPPEAMSLDDYGLYYSKTSVGLHILRNSVLGAKRFDYAFKSYITAWAMKHPTPYDFFRAMNDAAGEDLNWFWKAWFFTTDKVDQAVQNVSYVNDDPAQGALITLSNIGKVALPVTLRVTFQRGKTETIHLPVEIWQRSGSWTFKYPSKNPIRSVDLDPELEFPDVDRSNNLYKLR